jgi:sugar phosphate isomerase/epimerase
MNAVTHSEIGEQPEAGQRAVPNERIGVVGYTVRAAMPAPDTEATLAALASCGYVNIEPSGSGLYGYTAAELAALISAAGLQAPSVGLGLDDIENDLGGVVTTAKTLGARYVRISGSRSWDEATYVRVAGVLNEAGARTKEDGIRLAYHNHAFEFEAAAAGRLYDVLVRGTDPGLVDMELDLYWAVAGGVDPVDLFREYPGRFPLLHVKDRASDGSIADVGAGTIDFARIFAHSELAGVEYYFTENDSPKPDGISSACASHTHLSALRY